MSPKTQRLTWKGARLFALAAILVSSACGFTNNNIRHPRHSDDRHDCDCKCACR